MYEEQTSRPADVATPNAFITDLHSAKAIEFKTLGVHHHFNLQLNGCLETFRIHGRKEFRQLIVPGHASLTTASEELHVRVQPVSHSQALHCMIPVQWMQDLGEQSTEFNKRINPKSLSPLLGIWSPTLIRSGARLIDALSSPQSQMRLRMDSLFLDLAVELWKLEQTSDVPYRRERLSTTTLTSTLEYMNENLGQDISLQELANVASLSPFHFSRAFRAAVGTSPWQYLGMLRIESARNQLTNSELTLTGLALQLGYSSSSHFSAAFRATMGVTPSAYRQMTR